VVFPVRVQSKVRYDHLNNRTCYMERNRINLMQKYVKITQFNKYVDFYALSAYMLV